MTRLLFDTDAFCKLGVADLLDDTMSSFSLKPTDCGRLPALPHMLRRGRLVRQYGEQACTRLVAIADAIPSVLSPSQDWLVQLADVATIDVGEAQLYAVAAERGSIILSGDKRALRTIRNFQRFCVALDGRIVVLEAVLLKLCQNLGTEVVRARLKPVAPLDKMIAACFSETNSAPPEGLRSYFSALATEVHPLVLWDPEQGVTS